MAPIVMFYVDNFPPLTLCQFFFSKILARGIFRKLLDKAIIKEKSLNHEV